jgi:hypothetical protein
MRLTTIFIYALVYLLVVSIKGDNARLTTSEIPANGQSTNNSGDSSSQEQFDESLNNEILQWYQNQPLNFDN